MTRHPYLKRGGHFRQARPRAQAAIREGFFAIGAKDREAGFTLVELIVSMGLIIILMLALLQMTDAVRRTTTHTAGKIEQFREARDAFEAITRRLSQATLNTYNDIEPKDVATNKYVRASELRFISGNAKSLIGNALLGDHPGHAIFFQAPFGYVDNTTDYSQLETLLNTWGFFLEWGSDQNLRPPFLPASIPLQWRFRLMELADPAESLTVYKYTSGSDNQTPPKRPRSKSWNYTGKEWFQDPLKTTPPVPPKYRPIAENILMLVFLPMVAPKDAEHPKGGDEDGTSTDIAPDYKYDSADSSKDLVPASTFNPHNQLPPMVQVIMVAADPKTFGRYQSTRGAIMPDFEGFISPTFLTDATYETRKKDLDSLIAFLQKNHIDYRVFSSAVPLVSKGPSN